MKKESTAISFAGIIMALGMTISPLPKEFKIISAIAGFGISADLAIKDRKSHENKLAEQKRIRDELNLKALEIEHQQGQLEDDLGAIASLRSATEIELSLAKEKQIAELVSLEEQGMLAIASQRQKAEAIAQQQLTKERNILTQTWLHGCNEFVVSSMSAINELEAFSQFVKDERQKSRTEFVKAFKGLRSRVFLKSEREKANLYQQFEMSIDDAGLQIGSLHDNSQQRIQEFEQLEIEKIDAQTEEGDREYIALVKGEVKENKSQIKALFNSGYVSLFGDISSIGEQVEGLKETIEVLQGKLVAIAKPKFCPYSNRAGEKANEFIRFVHEAMDIKLVWLSSLFLTGDCLQVDFGLHDSEKKDKAIAKLQKDQNIEALCVRFGNDSVIIAPNHIDHCWRATIPANEGYKGNDEVYQVSDVAEDLEESLKQQMDFAQTQDFMMNFTPIIPLMEIFSTEPTNQELATLNWFFFWRKEATGKANVVTIPGLLREVYGVSEEQSRAINPVTSESLSDRLARLLPEIKERYGCLVMGVQYDA